MRTARIPECSEEQFREELLLTEKYRPATVPLGWRKLPHPMVMNYYERIGDKLAVIVSACKWPGDPQPDRVWLHVSMSRKNKLPTYQDMAEVKELFVGKERKALQIFAEESQHVNIHPYCLHLWCLVEGDDGLPDFGAYGSI
jgi:hypothetical protein